MASAVGGGADGDAAGADVRRHGAALWITFDRPHVGNALGPDAWAATIAALEGANGDPDIRVVVLAAEGRHFCTGADLTDTAADPAPGDAARLLRTGTQRLVASVLDCEKPVVVELHGAAAGLGAQLVLAADFVVAAEDARLIEVAARRGLVPDCGGAYLLPRLVGVHVAKRLLMLADDVTADDLRELGVVDRVVAADGLRDATEELVERLSSAPTRTLALTKWLVNRSLDSTRDQAFADEAMAVEQAMGTADVAEGMAAFAERRPPSFTGR